MRRAVEDLSRDLFEVPMPAASMPESMNCGAEVAHLVSAILKACPKDRYAVSAEMSRLTGKDVSKLMIDGWSSEARDNFNMPHYLVPAFECATDTYELSAWLAAKRGARLYVGREALVAGLGQLQAQRDHLDRQVREMKRKLGGAR